MPVINNGSEIVAVKRYYKEPHEGWKRMARRVGEAVASVEEDKNRWTEAFANLISEKWFIPGGRILRNAGQARRNLLNCFVIPIEDSIEAIGSCMRDSLITWSSGGGVGVNFSPLRPKGAKIEGKGGHSSGLVSFMEAMNALASTIEVGGQRRSATIAIVDISHPEIEEFMDSKLKHGKLSYFNISVAINNRFLEAVEQDEDWELVFRKKVYKTVKARALWGKILKNMIDSAEPGLINFDNLTKDNSYFFNPVIATNPCSELPLGAYGSCDLGSLVLPKFVSNKQTQWKRLEDAIRVAVRFLDNVLDITDFPVPAMKAVSEEGRRVGLGVMGLADYLYEKNIKYGSEKSSSDVEQLFRFIRNVAYDASVELAKEKTPFPKFDALKYSKSSFIKKLPAKTRKKIKKFGIRNVSLLTCPPTGTTSLVAGTTSGIEPLFSKAHRRVDQISERTYIHPLYRQLLQEKKKIPEWFVDSFDLTPEGHFEMQAVIQKYIDGAISKTVNCHAGTKVEQLSDWLLEYAYELKGITIYVDKSRDQQVLYPLSKKEVMDILKKKGD